MEYMVTVVKCTGTGEECVYEDAGTGDWILGLWNYWVARLEEEGWEKEEKPEAEGKVFVFRKGGFRKGGECRRLVLRPL